MSFGHARIPPDLDRLEPEYELIREIGRGGMAAVYLARKRSTGLLVAIKAIRAAFVDDHETVSRFAREARTVAGLDHPNIVRTHAIEQIEDRVVAIVMQLVEGGTLRDAIGETVAFSYERTERVLRDIAAALRYAHDRGIVHRDVKPENIFLETGTDRALLSDFGIARPVDGETKLTLMGAALGTPNYMSPEQIEGREVDGRSDVYSLGVVGWELISGRIPWEGEGVYGVIYKQKHEDLPRLTDLRPGVPTNLLFAIEGALHKHPDTRWANLDEFIAQLDDRRPLEKGAAEAERTPIVFRDEVSVPYPPRRDWRAAARSGLSAAARTSREVADYAARAAVRVRDTASPAVAGLVARGRAAASAAISSMRDAAGVAARRVREARFVVNRGRLIWTVGVAAALVVATASIVVLANADGVERDEATSTPTLTTSAGTLAEARHDSAIDSSTVPRVQPVNDARGGLPDSVAASATPVTRPASGRLSRCRSSARDDQRACLMALLDRNDVALNRTYQALIAQLKREAGLSPRGADPPTVQRLRVAQRSWILTRDAECRRRNRGREGALWAPTRARCIAMLSNKRARELSAELVRLRAN